MSQKSRTPFDSLLGQYIFPPTISHNRYSKKSFLFVGDGWKEVGDLLFVLVKTGENTGYLKMSPPDIEKYATEHESEGALDWLNWGPRLN